MDKLKLRVIYGGREYTGRAEPGSLLADAIREALGWFILPCGGRGVCGQCRVKVLEGRLSPPTRAEARLLHSQHYRLACQARLLGDAVVEVKPLAARLSVYGVEPPLAELDPLCSGLAAAVDIGSSKIAAVLVDTETGSNAAEGFTVNPQAAWGLDVVSRISRVMRDRRELGRMREATMREVNRLLARLSRDRGRPRCTVFTGNAAALPIAFGVDPSPLGAYPYENPLSETLVLDGGEAGLDTGEAYVLPAIKSFVGSDASTAILATMLHGLTRRTLMLDIGVNTEEAYIVEPGEILVASAPAGPAIEGGQLSCGATALRGGAVYASYDPGTGGFKFHPPGSERAGLTGSAIVSLLASLLENGFLDETGRIRRAHGREGGVDYISLSEGLRLTQLDIREFQKAKAAISAAAAMLIEEAAAKPLALMLAGSMGSGVDVESAFRIGLLPRARSVYQYGNLALVGAKLYLLSGKARRLHSAIYGAARHVETYTRRDYMDVWMRCLRLGECPLGAG